MLMFLCGYEMKLGPSHSGKNTSWGCSRIGCWGSYWDLREKRELRIGEDCIRRSYIKCTPRHILFNDHIKKNARDGACNTYRGEGVHTGLLLGDIRDGDHLEDIGVNVRILKLILKKKIGEWTGLMWLKTAISGSLLWKRLCIMGLPKLRGMSWPAEKLLASEGLGSNAVR